MKFLSPEALASVVLTSGKNLLGLDVGTRCIGVSLLEMGTMSVHRLDVIIQRANKTGDEAIDRADTEGIVRHLKSLMDTFNIGGFLVGYPVERGPWSLAKKEDTAFGSHSIWGAQIKAFQKDVFGGDLKNVPWTGWNEHYTTMISKGLSCPGWVAEDIKSGPYDAVDGEPSKEVDWQRKMQSDSNSALVMSESYLNFIRGVHTMRYERELNALKQNPDALNHRGFRDRWQYDLKKVAKVSTNFLTSVEYGKNVPKK